MREYSEACSFFIIYPETNKSLVIHHTLVIMSLNWVYASKTKNNVIIYLSFLCGFRLIHNTFPLRWSNCHFHLSVAFLSFQWSFPFLLSFIPHVSFKLRFVYSFHFAPFIVLYLLIILRPIPSIR